MTPLPAPSLSVMSELLSRCWKPTLLPILQFNTLEWSFSPHFGFSTDHFSWNTYWGVLFSSKHVLTSVLMMLWFWTDSWSIESFTHQSTLMSLVSKTERQKVILRQRGEPVLYLVGPIIVGNKIRALHYGPILDSEYGSGVKANTNISKFQRNMIMVGNIRRVQCVTFQAQTFWFTYDVYWSCFSLNIQSNPFP